MITTELWNGQGLGNQLACYVTTRCLALDNGYEWGISHPERFKGASFLELNFGKEVKGGYTPVEGKPPVELPESITNYYQEQFNVYDEDLKKVPDNTKIDGWMQGEGYFGHRKNLIRKWLKVKPLDLPPDLCIINFRGGEYKYRTDFFLPASYWTDSMKIIQGINPFIRFEVRTDDIEEAQKFFPNIPVNHDMEMDYRSVQYAKYLILSNSTFAWFPAWLNTRAKMIIYPKYFGNFNSNGPWSLETNKTRGWWALDKEGKLKQT